MIHEKYRLILFGRYPYAEQWRPLLGLILLVGMIGVSCNHNAWGLRLAEAWAVALAAWLLLMWGGVAGLTFVPNNLWGGLPLTLILTVIGLAVAFPLSIFLALGRRSRMPVIRILCRLYIELIRGVPLISLLFMASFMLPLFLPAGVGIDEVLRAQVAIILFSAAYLAEAVRGGLQAIPRGQYEAAHALGLSYWQARRKIIPAASHHGGHPVHRQHLHRAVQGHLAGGYRQPYRPAAGHAPGHRRPAVAPVFHRRLHLHRVDLFRGVLLHVEIQPVSGNTVPQRTATLIRPLRTEAPPLSLALPAEWEGTRGLAIRSEEEFFSLSPGGRGLG